MNKLVGRRAILGALFIAAGVGTSQSASADSLQTIPSGAYSVSGNMLATNGYTSSQMTLNNAVAGQITTQFWNNPTGNNGQGSITFDFQNLGTVSSIITGIFFQDGKWLATSPITIADSSGVVWTTGGNPGSLPGGNNVGFVSDVYLDTQSNQKGIGSAAGINNNPPTSDELQLTFNYVPGQHFQDVLTAFTNKSLEVGFFVQAIGGANGYSASFVGSGETPPPTPGGGASTPTPASFAGGLGLIGGLALLTFARRSRSATI